MNNLTSVYEYNRHNTTSKDTVYSQAQPLRKCLAWPMRLGGGKRPRGVSTYPFKLSFTKLEGSEGFSCVEQWLSA